MRKVIVLFTVIAAAFLAIACSDEAAVTIESGSPMEAYRNLFNAVKAKDTAAIKAVMSKGSIALIEYQAKQSKSPLEKVYENGLTRTTFAETLPAMRDQRIEGDFAAVEVWNERDKTWEDLPFVREDGSWKLALGDAFAGRFKSPGPGRARKEAIAANALNNTMIRVDPANTNAAAVFNGNGANTNNAAPANITR